MRVGREGRLVSKVVDEANSDEANSELLNIEEVSKPNRTTYPPPLQPQIP